MARREYDQIVGDLKAGVTAGKIWNVDYKDISEDANRTADIEKRDLVDPFEKRGDDYFALSVADRHMLHDWDIPYSVLHYPGWLKRSHKKLLAGSLEKFPELAARLAHIKRWAVVAELLKEARPLIVKGRKPNTGIVAPRSNTICQICGRQIELFGKTIAHHGYERPGTGWQTQSCEGARELSFNLSRDILGKHLNVIAQQIECQKELVANYVNGKIATVPGPQVRRKKDDPLFNEFDHRTWYHHPSITSGHAEFEKYYKIAQFGAESELRQLINYQEFQRGRYNRWKPQPEILA